MTSTLIILIALAAILYFLPKKQSLPESFKNDPEIVNKIKTFLPTPKSYDDFLCKALNNLGDDDLDLQDTTLVPSQNIPSDELEQVVSFVLDNIKSSAKKLGINKLALIDVTGTVNRSESFAYYEIKGMLHNYSRFVTHRILAEVYVTDTGFKLKRITTTCNNPVSEVKFSESNSYDFKPLDLQVKNMSLDIGYPPELDSLIDGMEVAIKESDTPYNVRGNRGDSWLLSQ